MLGEVDMALDIPIEFIALVGILLGVVGRTVIPYIKKVNDDPNTDFDWSFFGTMVFSGIVAAVFVYPLFVIPEGTPITVLVVAFIFAWSANDVVNRIAK